MRPTVTFTTGPVWTKLDYPDNPELRDLIVRWCRWPVPNARFSRAFKRGHWDGTKSLFKLRNHTLPTGLSGPLARHLRAAGLAVRVGPKPEALRTSQDSLGPVLGAPPAFPGFTWSPAQVQALEAGRTYQRGIFQMSVATGKGEIIAGLLATYAQLPTLILVGGDTPTDLAAQLHERFSARLGRDVGYIGSGVWEPGQITLALIPTLWARFDDPATQDLLRNTQLLIMDEVQGSTSASASAVIRACRAPRRYGFSARALDHTGGDRPKNLADAQVTGLFGPVIYELTQYQVAVRIWWVPVPAGVLPSAPWVAAYKHGILLNRARNGLIARASARWAQQGYSTLVQYQRLEHGEELARLNGGVLLRGADSPERRRRVRQRFNTKQIKLLNVSRIMDVGVDLPAIDRYILGDAGKSYRRQVQRIGRAARSRPDKREVLVLYPATVGHPRLEQRDRQFLRLCKAEGFIVEKFLGSL